MVGERVRCGVCHREELWSSAGRDVEVPGGSRKPSEAPALAAWRVLARSRAGELGPVVAACPACGMPMTAAPGSSLDPLPAFVLSTPAGEVQVGERVRMPDGAAVDDAFVTTWLEAELGERIAWGGVPVALAKVAAAGAILLMICAVWLWGTAFLTTFLYGYAWDGAR